MPVYRDHMVSPISFQQRLFYCFLVVVGVMTGLGRAAIGGELRSQITQFDVTWTFDSPHVSGQFVNGDWWVVGPVIVTAVSPATAPAGAAEPAQSAGSRYGAKALGDNGSVRNGSMVNPAPRAGQGYDSRPLNFDAALTVKYPLTLHPGSSLVSTVSATKFQAAKDGSQQLATPFLPGQFRFALCPPEMPLALRSAAILTCVDAPPPEDAFRPAYCGNDRSYHRERDLKWQLLPSLKPPASTPDWKVMERMFERPWLDHDSSWFIQYWVPGENQPNYGREFARMTSIGSLMLCLDVPQAQKRKLLIEYVQLGIDLSGLAKSGRQWYSDGGHWQGRKWPILFASLLLGDEHLRDFPLINPSKDLYGRIRLDPAAKPTTTLFQEDLDTYFGAGGDGQRALWQIVYHTAPRSPYQEKSRAELNASDKFVDAYYMNNAASSTGTALAALHMGARSLWNHDAFFELADYWMSPDLVFEFPTWLPKGCHRGVDLFVEDMWHAHRASAPRQPPGKDNLKWVYTDGRQEGDRFLATRGMWIPNPPGTTPPNTRKEQK